ncbi:MAG: hypothetical protein ACJ72Y_04050 [Actinomycetes bacterium]
MLSKPLRLPDGWGAGASPAVADEGEEADTSTIVPYGCGHSATRCAVKHAVTNGAFAATLSFFARICVL